MEFPNLGQHCSESTCRQLDFLPMKCDACGKVFCVDHFTYLKHNCDSAYKKDVQVSLKYLYNMFFHLITLVNHLLSIVSIFIIIITSTDISMVVDLFLIR